MAATVLMDLWSRPRPVVAPTGYSGLDPENVTSMRHQLGHKIFSNFFGTNSHSRRWYASPVFFAPTAGHLRAPSRVLFLFVARKSELPNQSQA